MMTLLIFALLLAWGFYIVPLLLNRKFDEVEDTSWEEFERENGRAEHKDSNVDVFHESVNSPFARPLNDRDVEIME